MIVLDLLSDGSEYDYTQTTVLDGVSCVIRMLYNGRRECWTISMSLKDGTALIEGQTVVTNVDFLHRCFVTGRPPGNLFAGTFTSDGETAGLEDLGTEARLRIFYVPESEIGSG